MSIFSALIYYGIIIPISLMPFKLLYFISDILYLLVYKLIGYRTKVVKRNMQYSFPEKTAAEIQQLMDDFYHHFFDLVVETFKSFTMSFDEIAKRMVLIDNGLMEKYFNEGKSVIIAGPHYNNWEWVATGGPHQLKHKSVALYMPLSNKFFDNKMRDTRGKFGLKMESVKRTAELFEATKNEPTAFIFGVDQSPGNPKNAYWMQFLNQDTGVLFGTEKYAKKYNYPVVFGLIKKLKRGYYTLELTESTDNPEAAEYGQITEKFMHQIEAQIIQDPRYWLWTHRRWKHKRPTE